MLCQSSPIKFVGAPVARLARAGPYRPAEPAARWDPIKQNFIFSIKKLSPSKKTFFSIKKDFPFLPRQLVFACKTCSRQARIPERRNSESRRLGNSRSSEKIVIGHSRNSETQKVGNSEIRKCRNSEIQKFQKIRKTGKSDIPEIRKFRK